MYFGGGSSRKPPLVDPWLREGEEWREVRDEGEGGRTDGQHRSLRRWKGNWWVRELDRLRF